MKAKRRIIISFWAVIIVIAFWGGIKAFNNSGSGSNIASVEGFFRGKHLTGVKPYQEPSISVNEGSVTISGGGQRPAGVYLYYDLDPINTYQLLISGKSLKGLTTLRIRKDGGEPKWTRLVDGDEKIIVYKTSRLEVLVYADNAFSYQIRSIRIESCPACKTDDDLQRLLLSVIPGLQKALKTDRLEGARLLMNWAANAVNHIDVPNLRKLAEDSRQFVTRKSASQSYYELFLPRKGGVICGGMSSFFDKILKLFGYNSFIINFGDLRDNLTHVTVVVAHGHQKGDQKYLKYFIFDPTFNCVFRRKKDLGYMTVSEMLDAVNKGAADSIMVDTLPLKGRCYLAWIKHYPQLKKSIDKDVLIFRGIKGDLLVVGLPNWNIYSFYENVSDSLRRYGYSSQLPESYVQLLKHRLFHVGQSIEKDVSKRFKQKMIDRGIPYGKD